MAICGIYGFLQISTGMWYIGQSIDIERREQEHRTSIAQDWHKLLLNNPNDFHFTILEECNPELLDERENHYIALYKSFENGFNSTRGNHIEKEESINISTSDFRVLFDDGEDEEEISRIIRAIRTKSFQNTLLKIINQKNYITASPIYWLRKKLHENCYLIQIWYFNEYNSNRDYKFIYLNLEQYIKQERDKQLEDIIKEDKIWWEDYINESTVFDPWYYIARKGNSYACNKYFQINKENFYLSSISIIDKDISWPVIHKRAQLQRIDCHPYW